MPKGRNTAPPSKPRARASKPERENLPAKPVEVRIERPGAATLKPIGGSGSDRLNSLLANQAVNLLWRPSNLSEEDWSERRQAALAGMMEFKPQDSVEGMMAAQAFGLHSASVECLRRAMISEQPSGAASRLLSAWSASSFRKAGRRSSAT